MRITFFRHDFFEFFVPNFEDLFALLQGDGHFVDSLQTRQKDQEGRSVNCENDEN